MYIEKTNNLYQTEKLRLDSYNFSPTWGEIKRGVLNIIVIFVFRFNLLKKGNIQTIYLYIFHNLISNRKIKIRFL